VTAKQVDIVIGREPELALVRRGSPAGWLRRYSRSGFRAGDRAGRCHASKVASKLNTAHGLRAVGSAVLCELAAGFKIGPTICP